MDVRRVQITGGSSFVMTLPKEWIKSLNIKKNDPLGVFVQSDGTLLITPKMTKEQLQRVIEFSMQHIPSQSALLRRLIGAYISGFTEITITSTTRLSLPVRTTVRTFTQMTIGQEVVEETDTSIFLKDLLNPTEMPFDRTIKRMHIIVKGMYEDIIRSFQTKEKTLAQEVLQREHEVDRLHWLVARQHNILLQNVSLAEKMGITTNFATTCHLISRIIERISDHIVRIAHNTPKLLSSNINEQLIQDILTAGTLSLEAFNKSMNSFFRKDVDAANNTIESVNKLEILCEEINSVIFKEKGSITLSIGYVVESIRRIGEYAEDISETVINYVVGETR